LLARQQVLTGGLLPGQKTSSEMEKTHTKGIKIALRSFQYGTNH